MKQLSFICAGLLILGVFQLPIGYYTFLRIIVSIGAVTILVNEFKGELEPWIITFGIIAILFNPILPIYLHDKTMWVLIDLVAGVLFGIKGYKFYNKNEH